MSDWLRPLAPLGYLIGAILVLDQVIFVISQGPYNLGTNADRFQLAILVGSRISAVGIGLLLLGGAAILSGHRRVIAWWSPLTGLIALAAALTAVLMIVTSPEVALSTGAPRSPDSLAGASASRLRVIISGLFGAIALMTLAVAVRGMATSPSESEV